MFQKAKKESCILCSEIELFVFFMRLSFNGLFFNGATNIGKCMKRQKSFEDFFQNVR